MTDDAVVELTVTEVGRTEEAYRFRDRESGATFWVPRSLVTRREDTGATDDGDPVVDVEIPEWKALEEGVI